MKTKKQIKAFILKTLLPFKEDVSKCAMDGSTCMYLTNANKKCAVGVWMKKGDWQYKKKGIISLLTSYTEEQVLLKPALDMGFTPRQWEKIQIYHDDLAMNNGRGNLAVIGLERKFDINLPELRVDLSHLYMQNLE